MGSKNGEQAWRVSMESKHGERAYSELESRHGEQAWREAWRGAWRASIESKHGERAWSELESKHGGRNCSVSR